MESLVFQLIFTTVLCSLVTGSVTNSTSCPVQCGTECCAEHERCSYKSLTGQKCEPAVKKTLCSDGKSYCIEPSTCCGYMSCCPSNTQCCGLNSCCASGAVCCGMSTCCPEGSTCCGFSTCCSRGSRCINGYCRAPWSSSMRWYYLIAVLIPFMFVLLYLAKRRQVRLAHQRGQILAFGPPGSRRDIQSAPLTPPMSGYDQPPNMFEPPPYSEIAQLPPDEKPPAYSELYTGYCWQEPNNDLPQQNMNNDPSLQNTNNDGSLQNTNNDPSQENSNSNNVSSATEGATGNQTEVLDIRNMDEIRSGTPPIAQTTNTQHNAQNTPNEGRKV